MKRRGAADSPSFSVVMVGATGAVGSEVAKTLATMPDVTSMTLLGRRPLESVGGERVAQHTIDIFDPASYEHLLPGHDAAICTLGVGQPSKMSREEFVRIDRDAVLDFARACKQAGVQHFSLLGAVGANAGSASFYLRTKGELEDGLRGLGFRRLSLFRPSMILTPTNRYGLSQAVTLALWPRLDFLLRGGWSRYRGIRVEELGRAMALDLRSPATGCEVLEWGAIRALARG